MSEGAGNESSILKPYGAVLLVQDVNNVHQIINKIVEDDEGNLEHLEVGEIN